MLRGEAVQWGVAGSRTNASVNLILLFEHDFVDSARTRATLDARRTRHVRKVLRAAVGDVLTVGLADGAIGEGRVVVLERDRVELEVTLLREPPEPLDVVLVLAVPRPPVLRRTLAAATSIGVKRIELIAAERVEKSFWSSHATDPEAIREQLVLGLEQGRDTRWPHVGLHRRFGEFVEDVLPGLLEGRIGRLAHPGGALAANENWAGPGLVAVGPEGGWVPRELEVFERCGLRPVGLGERALRVETAVSVLLGRHL